MKNILLNRSFIFIFMITCMSNVVLKGQTGPDINSMLDKNNVSWDVPGPGSAQSMPIGNGDIGLNVWVEPNGDLVFYISKTDSWSEDNFGSWGLLKLGKVRVSLNPQPTVTPFLQVLQLKSGEIQITENNTTFKVWVDANNPVIRVESLSEQPTSLTVTLENWRTKSLNGISADIISPTETNQLVWYHRNISSNPSLSKITFGAIIKGADLASKSSTVLESTVGSISHLISIYPLTATNSTVSQWLSTLNLNVSRIEGINLEATRSAHQEWWNQFWNRSWVFVRGDAAATNITQGYILQRFITACGGRGAYPIKFNGSIFVVDNPILDTGNGTTTSVNADYRTWGGQYWFQNTRAMYWPRLAAGDFDIMKPLFDMYAKIIPANAAQVLQYYGHEGAYFAETAPFWGGLKYAGPEVPQDWTLHYFTPILELSMMMLDYYEYTGDVDFATKTLLPVAKSGITFFDKHFKRDETGKLLLDPDNSIEQFWKVKNPAPDIAGLRAVLSRLIALPESLVENATRTAWSSLLTQIPELPTFISNGVKSSLLPYEGPQTATPQNGENPELYSVYPFRIYGLIKPDLQLAVNTFNARKQTFKGCWSQDPVQAAMLGLSNIAKDYVNFNLTRKDARQKFPAFWEKASDYSPDEDNGGNGENGLQQMIMQVDGKRIVLLPAWPKGWEGDFKLNAPFQTTVQGTISNDGDITNLIVTPAERTKDVSIMSTVRLIQTGWIASASILNENASNSIDGDISTLWSTFTFKQSPGQWFMVDMKQDNTFTDIYFDAGNVGYQPVAFQVNVSSDGTNWTLVASGSGKNHITLPSPQTARYIKIVQTGSSSTLSWHIAEFYITYTGSTSLSTSLTNLPVPGAFSLRYSDNHLRLIGTTGNSNISIYNVSGQKIITSFNVASGINIYLRQGMYVVEVENNGQIFRQKMLVN